MCIGPVGSEEMRRVGTKIEGGKGEVRGQEKPRRKWRSQDGDEEEVEEKNAAAFLSSDRRDS